MNWGIYSSEDREDLLEQDAISTMEDLFMQGYEEAAMRC